MQEGVILCVLSVICVYCFKTPGMKELVTKNNRMTILGIAPNFGLFILRSNSKLLAIN